MSNFTVTSCIFLVSQHKISIIFFVLFGRGVGKVCVGVLHTRMRNLKATSVEPLSSSLFLSIAITDYTIHTTISRIIGKETSG